MDPKWCLMEILGHIRDNECGYALDLLAEYRNWRKRGGFEPDIEFKGDAFASILGDLAIMYHNN